MKKMLEQRVYTDVEFGVNYVTWIPAQHITR